MSAAVPEIIQRFRARELKRLVNKNVRLLRDSNKNTLTQGSTATNSNYYLKSSKNPTEAAAGLKNFNPKLPLPNPFLPRPLFDRAKLLAEKARAADPEFQRAELLRKMQMSTRRLLEEEDAERMRKWEEGRRWAKPAYSLRRQKELVKKAREAGMLHLLPPGPKLSVKEWEEAVEEAKRKEAKAEAEIAAKEKLEAEAKAKMVQSEEANRASEGSEGTESTTATGANAAAEEGAGEALTVMPSTSMSTEMQRRRRMRAEALAQRLGSAPEGFPKLAIQYRGTVPEKAPRRLTVYSGRKFMFKGHVWERNFQRRRAAIRARVRDMPKRIRRFRAVYKRKKPRPLQPPRALKKETLPF